MTVILLSFIERLRSLNDPAKAWTGQRLSLAVAKVPLQNY